MKTRIQAQHLHRGFDLLTGEYIVGIWMNQTFIVIKTFSNKAGAELFMKWYQS